MTYRLSLLAVLFLAASSLAQGQKCLNCHIAPPPKDQSGAQHIDTLQILGSIHASAACTDCHTVDPTTRHKGNRTVFCGKCHQEEAESYSKSPHVKGKQASIEKIPTCVTCHGGHDIQKALDPNSRTSHRNAVKICIACHEDQKLTDQVAALPRPAMIKAFENSIHGQALLIKGDSTAPACVDCHGSHSFLAPDDPNSPVYKTHIAATCGRCHDEIAKTYSESVHGHALATGKLEAPTCTNCHGEHSIKAPSDPESKVYATNVSTTCSDCHTAEKIVAKFGLKADRIATFKESFHGAATELGDKRVANCASCHGVHDIYPQSDPRSLINTANIQNTCGKCHEGLPADFARGAVHTSSTMKESGGKFYVRQFYIWFISLLILGFIIYRVLEYKRRIKRVN
jgi:hypothetical protein